MRWPDILYLHRPLIYTVFLSGWEPVPRKPVSVGNRTG